ncbi:MAG: alkyl/aryl-sulfatase [Pseudomonadota bacterium]
MTPEQTLRAHDAQFEKKVHALSDRAFLAVGYAASNVGMIVGEDGLIVIDTTESTKAAENVLSAFRAITDKPVRTILYTHSHRDHISGATVFAEGREVEVLAHPGFDSDLVGAADRPGPGQALMARTARQFGIGLAQGTERINLGLGPGDRPMEGLGAGHLPPTGFIQTDGEALERCGVTLRTAFAPGECGDTVAVFLEEEKLLFPADNFYHGFPNLYAIRGTPYRDFDLWADSLAKLSAFGAEVLAPGHTQPVFGAEAVAERLGDYEAAIRWIVAETAAGMNAGLTPDELVLRVRLPRTLAAKPWLQEFYGTVEWAVRAYFAGTLGWFDGDPATLFPLPPRAEAERMARLAGGPEALRAAAEAAMAEGDAQWALELAGRVLRLDPADARGRAVRVDALRALAAAQSNACARNCFLLTAKQETAGAGLT